MTQSYLKRFVLSLAVITCITSYFTIQQVHANVRDGSGEEWCTSTAGGAVIDVNSLSDVCKNSPIHGGTDANKAGVEAGFSDSSKERVNVSSPQNTIASLLARIKALNEQIENGTSPIRDVRPNEGRSCLAITRSLAFGSVDGATADVTALQTILTKTGHYTGEITGYFGQKTKAAVQAFQKAEGIASAGDEESTGYGMVGEKTRAALKKHCATTPTSPTTPVGATYTLAEVATVTYTSTTVGGLTPGHKKFKYIITLKDGTKREFEHVGKNVNPKRASLEDLVEKTGYTGDVVDLLKMARKVETPVNNNILSY